MRLKQYRYFLPLILWLAACAPALEISSEPAADFQLSDYQTFSFFEVDASGDGLGTAYQPEIDLIKEEITRQLQQRGLSYTDSQPDLKINLGIVVDEEVQTRETNIMTDPPRYIGQRRYTWKSREVEVGRYNRGALSVHLVDDAANELVWQGAAESILRSDEEKRQEQITKGVQELVSRIPQ